MTRPSQLLSLMASRPCPPPPPRAPSHSSTSIHTCTAVSSVSGAEGALTIFVTPLVLRHACPFAHSPSFGRVQSLADSQLWPAGGITPQACQMHLLSLPACQAPLTRKGKDPPGCSGTSICCVFNVLALLQRIKAREPRERNAAPPLPSLVAQEAVEMALQCGGQLRITPPAGAEQALDKPRVLMGRIRQTSELGPSITNAAGFKNE